ncbi:MAG: T9SS type A sorting domain-containing protein [Paludibacter sp.]
MLNKKVYVSLIVLSGLVQTGLQAQSASTATGGNATGSGGTVSYSVGQTGYTTNTGTTGTVAQGVQQPYEISVVAGIEEAKAITLDCTAYPNPTTDFLRLKVLDYDTVNLTYQIYDSSGKQLVNRKVEGSETTISMQGLVCGSYFLKVTDNKQEIKTFKIIKN